MKLKFIMLILILFRIQTYAQTKSTLSLTYGTANSDIDINHAIGDFGYHTKRANTFGVDYTKQINKVLSLQTGLYYAKNDVEENSIYPGYNVTRYGTIKLITVPVLAKFTFLRYLYADVGFTVDIQTDYTSTSPAPKQSGVGFETGFGAQYTFSHFTIFASPYLQQHGVIRFDKSENFYLFNTGYKLGIGYNF